MRSEPDIGPTRPASNNNKFVFRFALSSRRWMATWFAAGGGVIDRDLTIAAYEFVVMQAAR